MAPHHTFHVAGWTCYATSTALAAAASIASTTMRSPAASAAAASTTTTTMHSLTHGRPRQALRRQRCTTRPLFTRPAWPRRTLRPHDHERATSKQSAHAVALCSPCAHHDSHYTARVAEWTWYATSTALAAAASTSTTTMSSPAVFHTPFISQQRE
jgi:hypothetical protein